MHIIPHKDKYPARKRLSSTPPAMLEEVSEILAVTEAGKCEWRYITQGRNGCCQRSPGNRLKSESVDTIVQPCSIAIAACLASRINEVAS